LRRAVASVCAQEYPHWEIILVDDGSTDQTPEVVAQLLSELGDDRLRAIRISQGGVCAARNQGLAVAKGAIIAYLDDDNAMHRLWLKSVAWAFSQRPDVDVVYGGIMVDDFGRLAGESAPRLPSFRLNPFDEARLREYNLADIGAIAHRKLADVCFDESLQGFGDWDLLFRLTRAKAPLVLPVLACYYTTSAPNRLSEQNFFPDEMRLVQERLRR
jgi:glycosyltransferase involved in cell wall biosynthesis